MLEKTTVYATPFRERERLLRIAVVFGISNDFRAGWKLDVGDVELFGGGGSRYFRRDGAFFVIVDGKAQHTVWIF